MLIKQDDLKQQITKAHNHCLKKIKKINLALDLIGQYKEQESCVLINKYKLQYYPMEERRLSPSFLNLLNDIKDTQKQINQFSHFEIEDFNNSTLHSKYKEVLSTELKKNISIFKKLKSKSLSFTKKENSLYSQLEKLSNQLEDCTDKSDKLSQKIFDLIYSEKLKCNPPLH